MSFVVFTGKLFQYDQYLYGVDEMPDAKIKADAQKVAGHVVEKFF
jgi:hypothetical protein